MGGEYEKTLTQKAEPAAGTPAGKPVVLGNLRMHNNATEGKVHFHDDARKLKVAVPTADYFSRFNSWIVSPNEPLHFVDADHGTELVMVVRRTMKNPPELEVHPEITQATIGDNLKLLLDFVNAK